MAKKSTSKKSSSVFGNIIIISICATVFLHFCHQDKASLFNAMKSGEAYSVSSIRLARDYHSNEVNADNKYKDKLLQVTGKVYEISKDVTDDTVISLQGTDMFQRVNAYLLYDDDEIAPTLKKGNHIKIRCYGDGEVIGSPMLRDCIFIEY